MSRTGLRSDCRRRVEGREFWRKMDDLRERMDGENKSGREGKREKREKKCAKERNER